MAKKRIFVDKNGDAIALYDEKFGAIADYGNKQINRASDVEFNNTTGFWEVRVPSGGPMVAQAISREIALHHEKELVEQIYEERLKNSCPIHS